MTQWVSCVIVPSWQDKMVAVFFSDGVSIWHSAMLILCHIAPSMNNPMQSICSINIPLMSCCNTAPGMNTAYGNHMKCKSHCEIQQDLICDTNKHTLTLRHCSDSGTVLVFHGDLINCCWVCTSRADETNLVCLCTERDPQFLYCESCPDGHVAHSSESWTHYSRTCG